MDKVVLEKLRAESYPLAGNVPGIYFLFDG